MGLYRMVPDPDRPGRWLWRVNLRKLEPTRKWFGHSRRGSEVTDCADWGGEAYGGLYGEGELTIFGVSGGTLKAARGRGSVSYRGSD